MSHENMFAPNQAKIIDPLIDFNQKCSFPILHGGLETTERTFPTNSYSQTSCQFSVPPPSPATFVSRRFLLKMPVTVVITNQVGLADQGQAFQAGCAAFRQYPLASAMETLDVSINGQSTTMNLADIIKPLLLYHNNERNLSDREMSMSPGMRDQSQSYNDFCGIDSGFSNRNPLSIFGDSNDYGRLGRGAFPMNVALSQTGGGDNVATITTTLAEELFLSPLIFGGKRAEAFIGINKIEINITWSTQRVDKMWSSAVLANQGAQTVTITFGAPSMMFRYVTPPDGFRVPRFIQYSYNEFNRYSSSQNDMVTGSTAELVSNNIQINAIPRYVWIYARRKNSPAFNFNKPDAYLAITNCSIDWNNSNSLLASATQQQLYDISRKNGVNLSWNEWSAQNLVASADEDGLTYVNGIGSVLCIEFGTDIGLKNGETAGQIGTYNLQIKINVKSYYPDTESIELYIVTSIPGVFTIFDMSASKRIGVVGRASGSTIPGLTYDSMKNDLMSGGFKIKKTLRAIGRIGKKLSPYANKYIPKQYHGMVSDVLGATKAVGRKTRKNRKKGSAFVGGMKKRKGGMKKRAGGKSKKKGGKAMSRKQLIKYLNKI